MKILQILRLQALSACHLTLTPLYPFPFCLIFILYPYNIIHKGK